LPGFDVLSGDDFITLPLLSIGGVGVISVTGNIVPKDIKQMITAFQNGDIKTACKLHYKLWPLHEALFLETNPIPVKAALALMGMIDGEIRLPLTVVSETNSKNIENALSDYGLL